MSTTTNTGLTPQQIQFAKECADPHSSLSIPDPAKQVIRYLLAEVERPTNEPAQWADLCTCSASSMFTGPSRSCLVNHAVVAAQDPR